ncbi:MAG: PEP-CTERM sorting domain-containing protein [Planctomycetota bacterium]
MIRPCGSLHIAYADRLTKTLSFCPGAWIHWKFNQQSDEPSRLAESIASQPCIGLSRRFSRTSVQVSYSSESGISNLLFRVRRKALGWRALSSGRELPFFLASGTGSRGRKAVPVNWRQHNDSRQLGLTRQADWHFQSGWSEKAMTRKSIFSIVAVAVLSATTAQAQTFRVADAGLSSGERVFEVYVTPATDGNSVAIEFGADFSPAGGVDSMTSIASYTLNDGGDASGPFGETVGGVVVDNVGNNPFTTTVTATIAGTLDPQATGLDADQLFAAEGSEPLTGETLAFSFTIADDIGVFELTGSSLIAESGAITPIDGTFGINGDFDLDGDVDNTDFFVFAGNFMAMGVTPDTDGNFDGDTDVDNTDFFILAGNFNLDVANNGPGLATVVTTPEPVSALLFTTVLCGASLRRRRS